MQRPEWPYQHAKNEIVSSICSGEIAHLEILESDWLRGFWSISQEQHISQRICAGTQQIKIFNVEYSQN